MVNVLLYIVRFLHQTTTIWPRSSTSTALYIVRFLHQTTTYKGYGKTWICCISSVSYIKPQPECFNLVTLVSCISSVSYIKPQRHLYRRRRQPCCISSVSYIKPQRNLTLLMRKLSCISSVSYIKPQRSVHYIAGIHVVYRPFPTSNHNNAWMLLRTMKLYIVRFLHQTTTNACQ